uniref:Protein Red n=1 Tax=Hemiscolopendra marginata TaxID=943146 RepID=A0A646QG64_9MYRI
MPEREEPYSNPLPPTGVEGRNDARDGPHPMTNEDFRKLIMTPRAPPPSSAPPSTLNKTPLEKPTHDDDRAEKRRKKKSYYAKLKKQEEDKMAELAMKYRDRAKERRDGINPDYQNEDPISTTAGYRAVAPDAKSGLDAAERRRQMIQESKFLGGDMEHTHLVKGLDYALLQKVRSEISAKEKEEEELEEVVTSKSSRDRDETEEQIQFRTKFGKSIYRLLFRMRFPERNDHFLPGRMAYVIDLEDEYTESDIPTTLLRSKTDCPSVESQTTLTTNDIVINKLTQILSYLRQGARNSKKMKRKDKGRFKDDEKKMPDESIYGDIGDYVPSLSKSSSKDKDKRDKDRKKSYFEKPSIEDERDGEKDDLEKFKDVDLHLSGGWNSSNVKSDNQDSSLGHINDERGLSSLKREESKVRAAKILRRLNEPDSYAECYPGAPETADAIDDSDDEVDYTKMDMGNKKGPIGRWDFDTQEEYSEYMNQKEALPKAAFQYGVKMADGRKTRRTGSGKKDEKAELDREWQKISQIIAKRKAAALDGGEPEYKIPKY